MKRISIIILFIVSSLSAFSINKLDSLLKVLDKTVELRSQYSNQKEAGIASLKQQLSNAAVDKQRYSIYSKLFDLYSNYQTDSAYSVAEEQVKLADKMGSAYEIAESRMHRAAIFRTTGLYKETLEALDYLEDNDLAKQNMGYFYHLYHSLYMLMADYSISEAERMKYQALVFNYKDSILQILHHDDLNYYLVQSSKEIMLGEFDKALLTAQKGFDEYDNNSPMVTYTLSEIYGHLGNREEEKKYLAMSAIADLKSGVKEYISLRKLAVLLYNEGDVDRAYLYMKCAMEDAIFSNSRLRALEVSQMLPLINDTYEAKTKLERNRLVFVICLAILLVIILIVSVVYLSKKLKELAVARRSLRSINKELFQVNNNLNKLNSELSESNKLKEEYIGYVFNICSLYIDKLDNFRKKVNRQIKSGLTDELYRQTSSSSSLVSDELKEFYKSFDTVFLNLFPHFIDDFNSLLVENEHVSPKDGELLSPELRIYALVRLGINDSVKIASFLHYSPQTVYNYRLKIRNKAKLTDKSNFPKVVQALGKVEE